MSDEPNDFDETRVTVAAAIFIGTLLFLVFGMPVLMDWLKG